MRITQHQQANKLIVILLLLFLTSCSSDIEDMISGSFWDKRLIHVNGYDAFFCFNSPLMIFKKNGVAIVFKNNNREGCDTLNARKENGKWEVYQKEDGYYYMYIDIPPNEVFHGEHRIKFFKDTVEKLLILKLESKNLIYFGAKGMLYYDSNIKKIDKLIRITRDSASITHQP